MEYPDWLPELLEPVKKWSRHRHFYTAVFAVVMLVGLLIYAAVRSSGSTEQVDIGTALTWAQYGEVESFMVAGQTVRGVRKGTVDEKFRAKIGPRTDFLELMREHGLATTGPDRIDVTFKERNPLLPVLLTVIYMAFVVGLMLWLMRSDFGIGAGLHRYSRKPPDARFADVAGVDSAKQEVQEIVEFLRRPEKFSALGGRMPRGLLMVGPPGTGKTLLARAVAGEAGVPFLSVAGSEFVEIYAGRGPARVRSLFKAARRRAPSLVFIDEIDAIDARTSAHNIDHVVNQLLTEMDGFVKREDNIVVIAATNRPDSLDPALVRPGRFDRQVTVGVPERSGRRAILEVHSREKPLAQDVDLDTIATLTPGFSGADLANVLNEAAILAARADKTSIGMAEIEEGVDRAIAGTERQGMVLSPGERGIVAYHEAGHALVAWYLPHADPPYKVSIVSRGAMGGHTRLPPPEDRHLWTRHQLEDMLAVALGGRAAEEQVFEITTGGANDLDKATAMATEMVTEHGMSDLGPRTFGKGEDPGDDPHISGATAEAIDHAIQAIIDRAYGRARDVLQDHADTLHRVALRLQEQESIEGAELAGLIRADAGAA